MNTQDDSPNTTKPSRFHGLELLIVQSSVAVAAILIMLLLKVIGGDVFTVISAAYQDAMLEHPLIQEPENSPVVAPTTTTTTVTTTATAAASSADNVMVSAGVVTVCAPLENGVLTSPFGKRQDPFDESLEDVHHGVDIAAPENTPLAAMMNGTVSEIGYEENGYGHYVVVNTDDSHSYMYAHCSSIDTKTGDTVKAGDTIAHVGNTGRSTGSHVHVEWRNGQTPTNPMTVLPESTFV